MWLVLREWPVLKYEITFSMFLHIWNACKVHRGRRIFLVFLNKYKQGKVFDFSFPKFEIPNESISDTQPVDTACVSSQDLHHQAANFLPSIGKHQSSAHFPIACCLWNLDVLSNTYSLATLFNSKVHHNRRTPGLFRGNRNIQLPLLIRYNAHIYTN